ncbi:hypothetical protein ACHAPT_013589 [Fusarium lateritium]
MSEASGSGPNPGRHIISDATGADRSDAMKRAARRAKRRLEAEGSDATFEAGRTFTSYVSSGKAESTMGAESTINVSSVSRPSWHSRISSSSRPTMSSRSKSRPRFPDLPDFEPSVTYTHAASQPSTETFGRGTADKSRSSHSTTEPNSCPSHKTANKPTSLQSSAEPKSFHNATDKSPWPQPSAESTLGRKPTDKSSSVAKNSFLQPQKATQEHGSSRTKSDTTSQPSRPAPGDPSNSTPDQTSSGPYKPEQSSRPKDDPRSPLFKTPLPRKSSDEIPLSSSEQDATASDHQKGDRAWEDFRRNTLETFDNLSLILRASAVRVSTRFGTLVSFLAPFLERAFGVFRDALALVFWICNFLASLFDKLVPKILVHTCMVIIVAAGMIIFVVFFLAGLLKDKYCQAMTAVPYNIIPSPAFCLPSASQRNFTSTGLYADTLQGFQPRIPNVWQYLLNNLDSVDRDLMAAHLHDLRSSIDDFRALYTQGVQESEALERQFMRQQRALWSNVHQFIRSISPVRPEQHWILGLLGFVDTALVQEARDIHQRLIGILENSRQQTIAFQDKLSEDSAKGLTPFAKVFNRMEKKLRKKIENAIMDKAKENPHQVNPDDIVGSAGLWGASSDVVLDLLFHRRELLDADVLWLSGRLAELKGNLATLKGTRNVDKEVWEKQVNELTEKAWGIAVEWREKLGEYFVRQEVH